jgi:uncharacterized membrane-anchored protein
MNQQRHLDFLRTAQAQGLLPESASLPPPALVPWPVMLMTAIGAWLATIPLVAALHMVSNGMLAKGPGAFVVGVLLLLAGLFLLRRDQSLFMEQFILAALVLVGFVHLTLGVRSGTSDMIACLLMAPVAMAIGWFTPRRWLQCAFGALACYLLLQGANQLGTKLDHWAPKWWEATHAALCVWILLYAVLRGARADNAARLDAIAAGWTGFLLLALALVAGSASFFTPVAAHGGAYREMAPPYAPVVSVLLSFAAAAWAGRRWRALAKPHFVVVAAVAAGLAWLIPSLGAILAVLAFCATSGRYVLASAAGVAAVFTFSAFYYQLDVPLATKAWIMIAAGALLAAVAWITHPRALPKAAATPGLRHSWSASIVIGMVIVLLGINASIWQKEQLISTGAPVLVELAPVDPRSLMQGDFMRLGFRLPDSSRVIGRIDKVIGQRDERGVTQLTRFDDGSPLKPGELKIDLIRKNGGLTLVTDAWFFTEGDGKRWEGAKYGEFRVDASGKALLVGLRDDKLRPIR